VTGDITALTRRKTSFMAYLGRSNCHPCDRSEAGHQLALINSRLEASLETLSILTHDECPS
jgi:hypothetical protein